MLIHISCTANLGDFANALPVISGLSLSDGGRPVDLVIRGEMKKFVGIKELLLQQPCINSVEFDDEVFFNGAINLSSWTRMDQNDPNRPIETCRYENWIRDHYQINFQVDDNFELLIDPMNGIAMETTSKYIIGDRWNHPTIDTRRKIQVVKDGVNPDPEKILYLDYNKSLMYNLNMIKNSPKPFITTFTGIGILADLMNKETIVCWDEDMRMWDGHPVEYDFKRHYYGNRKSKLVYVKDVTL
jgi:hypothetical protein